MVVGPIALAGALRLTTVLPLLGVFALLVGLVVVTTVTVSLAFGVLWPDWREPSAERLATSVGGLVTILVCLLYVGGVGWLAGAAARVHAAGEPLWPVVGGGVALSLAVAAGAGAVALRRLRNLEVL